MTLHYQPGDRVGDLTIVRELGRGAFAVVYLARDVRLGREVALKVLSVSSLTGSRIPDETLWAEARQIASLQDPHIVTLYRVHDLGDDAVALEMEHMQGGSLAERLRSGPLVPPDEAVRLLGQVLSALEAAHAKGLVHRDVKPENLLFTAAGTLKLADFGLGRSQADACLSSGHGQRVVGTPLYMAPEVVTGEPASAASDLWSVGVIAYQMLSGRLPFEAGPLPALFYAILNASPEPLEVPEHPALERLVERLLAKHPDERPASASQALALLGRSEPAARVPAAVRPPPRPSRAGPPLLGRVAELARIDAALRGAREGRSSRLALLGDAGSGKSALVREAAVRAGEQGLRWMEAAVSPLGGVQLPLLRAARRTLLAESHGQPIEPEIRAELYGSAAPRLRSMLREEAPAPQSRQQFLWLASSLLRGLAGSTGLALAVEDLHLADAEEMRLLLDLASALEDCGIVFLVALREGPATPATEAARLLSEELAAQGAGRFEVLALAPLEESEVQRLILQEAGARTADGEVLERIEGGAEGNPLFAIQLTRHLLAEGAAVLEDGRLLRGPGWRHATPPRRVTDLLSARLAALTAEQREVLDAASVDGTEFSADALSAALELPLLRTLRILQVIAREHRLLIPQRSGFRFSHALFRDVLYEELAPDLRRACHRALAQHLDAREPAEDPERVGTHWEQAGEPGRARPRLAAAARAAAQRQQYRRAVDLGRRCGLLGGTVEPAFACEQADTLFALVGCLSDLGEHAQAREALGRLSKAAQEQGRPLLEARSAVWLADATFHEVGPGAIRVGPLAQAIEALGSTADAGRGHFLLGRAALFRGDYDAAEAELRTADRIFGQCDQPHLRAQVVYSLGAVAKNRGQLAEAEAQFARSAAHHAAGGRWADAAVAQILHGLCRQEQGLLEGVEPQIRSAITRLEQCGARSRATHATVYLGRVLIALGRLEEATATLEAALAALGSSSNPGGAQEACLELLDAYVTLDRLDRAADTARRFEALPLDLNDMETRLVFAAGRLRLAWAQADAAGCEAAASLLLDVDMGKTGPLSRESAAWRLLEAVRLEDDPVGGLGRARPWVERAWTWITALPAARLQAAHGWVRAGGPQGLCWDEDPDARLHGHRQAEVQALRLLEERPGEAEGEGRARRLERAVRCAERARELAFPALERRARALCAALQAASRAP